MKLSPAVLALLATKTSAVTIRQSNLSPSVLGTRKPVFLNQVKQEDGSPEAEMADAIGMSQELTDKLEGIMDDVEEDEAMMDEMMGEDESTCQCFANGPENEEYCETGEMATDLDACVNSGDLCHWGPGENEECAAMVPMEMPEEELVWEEEIAGEWEGPTCQCFANGGENEEYCQTGDMAYDLDACVNSGGLCHWGPGENEECAAMVPMPEDMTLEEPDMAGEMPPEVDLSWIQDPVACNEFGDLITALFGQWASDNNSTELTGAMLEEKVNELNGEEVPALIEGTLMGWDADGDGLVSKEELEAGVEMMKDFGSDVTAELMAGFYSWADTAYGYDDDTFTPEEALAGFEGVLAALNSAGGAEGIMQEVDIDESQTITEDEIVGAFAKLCPAP